MFTHENLEVYRVYLGFAGHSAAIVESADPWCSFGNHLSRATESIGTNMIRGSAQCSSSLRRTLFDVALGSTSECVACLDVARAKEVISSTDLSMGRVQLWRIRGMLVGLRDVRKNSVGEGEQPYGTPSFPHENLKVYQLSHDIVRQVASLLAKHAFNARQRNRIDETTTGILLNVAEGVAKSTDKDKLKFLDIAYGHSLQAALVLDLLVSQRRIKPENISELKHFLERVAAMLFAWTDKLRAATK